MDSGTVKVNHVVDVVSPTEGRGLVPEGGGGVASVVPLSPAGGVPPPPPDDVVPPLLDDGVVGPGGAVAEGTVPGKSKALI